MAKKKRPAAPNFSGGNDIPRTFETRTAAFNHKRVEAMVPMRDGVKLFTIILIPDEPEKPMPMILTRTPYNAAGRALRTTSPDIAMVLAAADEELVRDGYIVVYQDVRGRYGSQGKYIVTMPVRGPFNTGKVDQVTDAWDTVEWLLHNVPGNNGRVGITGVSYEGLLTVMALLEPHPALKAAVPVNSMVDSWMGDDFYHQGAFRAVMMPYIYRQTATKDGGKAIPWGYYDTYSAVLEAGSMGELGRLYGIDRLPAWKRLIDHPDYDDYWQDMALDKQLAKVPSKVPTLTVHSLFDQEDMYGPLASYAALAKKDRKKHKTTHLAIGPWYHGQVRVEGSSLGSIKWDADTSLQFRREMLKPFWDLHLKRVKPAAPLPPVLAFETGANRWHRHNSWPPAAAKSGKLYLHPGGELFFEAPAKGGEPPFTEYVSDPAKPVPYRVRPIQTVGGTWYRWLVDDQRPFADRPDVLTFVSQPVTAPLTLSGEVVAHLFASTTGSDADWVVKLIDLYPDEVPAQPELGGYQLMISGDIQRGRYRESFSEARPIPRGETLPYRIPMPHVNHTFLRGHRMVVQIQSSWFPVYDRNPQTFVDRIAWAKPDDFRSATQRIHHSLDSASFLELPIANAGRFGSA